MTFLGPALVQRRLIHQEFFLLKIIFLFYKVIASLNSLKFFLAVSIYLHHLKYKIGAGPIAVTAFFVLSGYLMALGYNNKFNKLTVKIYKNFLIKRCIRLYPLHVMAFSIGVFHVVLAKFDTSFVAALLHFFLFQTYVNIGIQVFYFSGTSWFIANLFFLYALTPFLVHLFSVNREKIKFIHLCALLSFFYVAGVFVSLIFKGKMIPFSAEWWFVYISPYSRIFDFISGFISGLIFVRISELNIFKLGFKESTLMEFFCLAVLFLYYRFPLTNIDSLRYDVYHIPVFLLVIIVFSFSNGLVSSVLSRNIFVLLGDLSFPLFLFHLPLIYVASIFNKNIYGYNGLESVIYQSLLFILILSFSYFIRLVYDRPLSLFLRRKFLQ